MAEEGASKLPSIDEDEKEAGQYNCRLWVGNIDKRLSEYNLLKILQKFGQIKYFEYLFHTSGPLKGEPRGYCFVEYGNKEEAVKALNGLNGKMALSRSLVVHWARDDQSKSFSQGKKTKQVEEKRHTDHRSLSSVSNDSKIQAIEAKLRLMDSASYSDDSMTVGRNKHPLLEESERNKPYTFTKTKRKSEWKVLKKPR